MTMLVQLLPPKFRRQYVALLERLRDIERSPGFIDLPDDDILVVEWRELVTVWADVRHHHGIASRARSLALRYLCCGRHFITLLLAVMLLATLGSCAETRADRCLKLTEAYKNLDCLKDSKFGNEITQPCANLEYMMSRDCR